MSIQGRLQDADVAELVQFLARNRKSGKLSVVAGSGEGVIVVREGKIIYSASRSVRETFGQILLSRRLISEETLAEALDRQQAATREIRLGAILVEMGAIEERDLVATMRQQTARVLAELLQWSEGEFSFEAMTLPRCGEVEIDAAEFLVPGGIDTDRLLRAAIADLDESQARPLTPSACANSAEPPGPDEPRSDSPLSLNSVLAGLGTPSLTGELTLDLLRAASRVMSRGVLFAVAGHELHDAGRFGVRVKLDEDGLPKSCLGLNEPSVLATAVREERTVRGSLDDSSGNRRLLRALGGHEPREGVAVPIHVAGKVAMVFYGDTAPGNAELGSIEGFELACQAAALSMVRTATEADVRELEPVS